MARDYHDTSKNVVPTLPWPNRMWDYQECWRRRRQAELMTGVSQGKNTTRPNLTPLLTIQRFETECKTLQWPEKELPGKRQLAVFESRPWTLQDTHFFKVVRLKCSTFIALYTAFLTWIDDTCVRDIMRIDSFNEQFVTGRKQAKEDLDEFDQSLPETNLLYHGF